MNVQQLSLFMENRPGGLLHPCETLAKAGIDILVLALADTAKFGILRIIVRDWRKAKEVLEAAGCVVNVPEVVAGRVASKPGGLAAILRTAEEAKFNVEYMYAFSGQRGDAGILIFRFADSAAAVKALRAKAVEVLDAEGLESFMSK
jgi:hypothetical protein